MDVCWQRWLLLQKAFQSPGHRAVPWLWTLNAQFSLLAPQGALLPLSHLCDSHSGLIFLQKWTYLRTHSTLHTQQTLAEQANGKQVCVWRGRIFGRTKNWNFRVDPSYRTWTCAKMIYYHLFFLNQTMTWKAAYTSNGRGLINNGTSIWWNTI